MSEIQRLHVGPKLSRVVMHNGIAYLCGQVDENYNDHVGDIQAQTKGVLERIDKHLAEAGTDKSNMLTATIHVKDITQAPLMNEIWNAWLSECEPPARACVQAEMANPNILVEIQLQAAIS